MKILIITRNAWDDTNAIGNTISNFFSGIDDAEFASIYFRSALPNNLLCKIYFRTSEIEVMRRWFKPDGIGRYFCLTDQSSIGQGEISTDKEKTLIRIIQKCGSRLAYKLSDYLWYSQKWINNNLNEFIEEFSPDVVFTFVKSAPQYYLTVKHLRENFNIPLFSWIADDEYTSLKKKGAKREIQNLQYILKESAVIGGCSQEICDYYHSVFGCDATPLYKSCDLSLPIKSAVGDPITIVYAGNLLYGRFDIICQVADVVEELNSGKMNVSFEIFSNTVVLPHEEKMHFEKRKFTKYMGKKDYYFIKRRLATADIVLHVESFEEEEILKTKYSFSTKIIDYLQSGSVILAVGPRDVASMRYIRNIPGALVVNDIKNLSFDLKKLLADNSNLLKRAYAIRTYAQQYHSTSSVSDKLSETINNASRGGV